MMLALAAAVVLAAWPAPLRAAAQAEASPPDFAFTAALDTQDGRYVAVRDGAGRWSLREGAALKNAKETLGALAHMKPAHDLGCAARFETIPAAVTLKSETADEAIYQYRPTPAADTPAQLSSAFKHSWAEIRVAKDRPRVLGGRVWLQTPFSPAPLAKVNAYDETFECAAGPGGASIVTNSVFTLDFSALGQRHFAKRVTTVSDWRALN